MATENITGGLNATETRDVENLRAALGQTEENVVATRKTMAKNGGDVPVSIGALTAKWTKLRNPNRGAMLIGGGA
jgi:hypothetical protein